MQLTEEQIRAIVEETVRQMSRALPGDGEPVTNGIYDEIGAAVAAAERAHRAYEFTAIDTRRAMIERIRTTMVEHAEELSRLAVEETGLGRVEDKVRKNTVVALKTPGVEDVVPSCNTDETGMVLVERASYGVIGAVTPSTNPSETIICNVISMIAGGNTVVVCPHPSARRVSCRTVALIDEAIRSAGGPPNLVTTISAPSIDATQAMMKDRRIALLAVTGGPGVVKAALASGRKVVAAGPGNPPCLVDQTADVEKAARDIVSGASLDNNIVCIDEKEVIVVASVADRLKDAMKRAGAVELPRPEFDRLTDIVLSEAGGRGHAGTANKTHVGKDAAVLADLIGMRVDPSTRLLFAEVDAEHPLVWTEQLMPVLPVVRVNTVDEGIDLAVACEHGYRHTASIHSKDVEAITRMARRMNCTLFVANGSNYNGLAAGGPGYTSYTIASPTGEGFTTARTFTRERRVNIIGAMRVV